MNTHFLFPSRFKPYGWSLFIPSLVLGFTNLYFDFTFGFLNVSKFEGVLNSDTQNLTDEISVVGLIIGLMIIGFSKLKTEDEYVQKIRLDSLLWATYLNCAFLILSTLFIYSYLYFDVLIYNLFTLPLFCVIRFHYYLSKR